MFSEEGGGFLNPLDVNPFDLRPMDLLGGAMALLSAAAEKEDEIHFVPSGRAALPVGANLCSIYITRVTLDGGRQAGGGELLTLVQRGACARNWRASISRCTVTFRTNPSHHWTCSP